MRWSSFSVAALLAASTGSALATPVDSVRDLAARVGPILGSALACRDIARPRVQIIIDKFQNVIREASAIDADRSELARLLDTYVADGRGALTSGRMTCRGAEQQLADLERSIAAPPDTTSGLPEVTIAAPSAMAATAPTRTLPAPTNVHGVTQSEIKFGMVMPFGGPEKERGRLMKLGIEAAFKRANEAGGINTRMLKLVTADDGYDPNKTLGAMKQLYEKDEVFGYIGNIGTATAAVAVPYALERRALFFGAFTGANVVRRDPPDRYVFNYRPSYAEETNATVQYLVKLRRLQPKQIAVFAQDDALGDSGYAGVAKAFRALGLNDSAIVRLSYPRNSVSVDDAVNQLKAQKAPIRAIIMVATTRPAAKFIEKTRDLMPGLIYANVSAVGASALASELMLLGSRYTSGVMVTQTVPGIAGFSSLVLEYKTALAKFFPGEAPDYTSLEGYISASILVQGLKSVGPQFDSDMVVDALENLRNLDFGLGANLAFGRADHQASHKIWGTALDETGTYQPLELE
jgi:ABC-type branched-subunit amino acid transport system substrate-binding protein